MKLPHIIKKNFKLLIRAKSSSLIVVLGPLLVIFLVGVAFDNANTYALQLGVYSESYNDLTESFIGALKEQEFQVQKVDSEESCVSRIKSGDLHTCVVFPPNMEISNEAVNEIVFHVDYSRINLVWMVIDTISAKVKSRSSEISENLTAVLLQKLDETRVEIYNKNPTVEALKAENNDLISIASSVKEKVASMDLSFNLDNFQIAQLKSSVQQQQSASTTIDSELTYMNSKINSIINDLEDINTSDTREAVDDLNEVKESLIDIENATGNATWSNINNMVTTVESQLNDVKSRLDTAVSAKSEVDSNVVTMSDALGQSKTQLEEVHLALQKIDASISGISVTKASSIVSPISTKIKPVTPQKTHLSYLFPSLLVIVIMFISIILSATLVMMEKNSPAYFRNLITPVRNITFIIGTYITTLIVVILQLAVILGISVYFFNASIFPNLWTSLLILFLISSAFIFIGMAIGYIFKSEETSTLASISISSIFLLLSDVIIPMESMPNYLLTIARYNPFVISESLIKRSVMFNIGIKSLAFDIYFILGWFLAFFLIILIFQFFRQKQYFHRMAYKTSKFISEKRKSKKNQAKTKPAKIKPKSKVKPKPKSSKKKPTKSKKSSKSKK
ncbi:ABC transporter permease [Candidatus Woesearchaeota archaeon]|nr:ABC transporter permease [Candidatus Woesearchaeota archaeon]